MTCRLLLTSSLLFAIGFAQIQIKPSATQAILRYTAPDTAPCLISVTQYGSSAQVNATNPTLFPGANLDSGGDVHRTFILAGRDSGTAADTFIYSLALQAFTRHSVIAFCSTATLTGEFVTVNPRLGNSYNDPLPPLTAAPYGQYNWPTIQWNNQNQDIIDPQTGYKLRRIDSPGDATLTQGTGLFLSASGAAWVNPNNALADDSSVATFTGVGRDYLYLGLDLSFLNSTGHTYITPSANSIQTFFNAWCGSAPCSTASAADLSIEYCWTLSGPNSTSCDGTDVITAQLVPCLATCLGATYRFQLFTGTALPLMGDWFPSHGGVNGYPYLDTAALAKRTGTVNRTGAAVTWVGGDYFNLKWGVNSTITINATPYTILAVTSSGSLTLNGAPGGTDSGVAYSSSNAGLLIRKKTTSTHQVFVQYAGYTYTVGNSLQLEAGSDQDVLGNGSPIKVAGPGGAMGWHYKIGSNLYWINATTMARSRIGSASMPYHPGPPYWSGPCALQAAYWSQIDGNVLYCPVTTDVGDTLLLTATYSGSNADIGDLGEFQAMVDCGVSAPPCWTIVNLTPPGSEINTQLAAFAPNWNGFMAQSYALYAHTYTNNSLLFAVQQIDSQNTTSWFAKFNLTSKLIDGVANSWQYWPLRWAGSHGAIDINHPIWADIEATYLRGQFTVGAQDTPGNGPYYSTVTSGAINATGDGCPARPGGSPIPALSWPVGNFCKVITVDGQPGDPSPAYYNDGTVSAAGTTTITGSGTTWTKYMTGRKMLITGTYYTFTFVSATSGTLNTSPGTFGATAYKLYLEPVNTGFTGPAAFGYLQPVAVNDVICIVAAGVYAGPGGCDAFQYPPAGPEYYRVIIVSGTTWTLQRGFTGYGTNAPSSFTAVAAGGQAIMWPPSCQFSLYPCAQPRAVWNFISDPFGTNTNGTGTTILANPGDLNGCCHASYQNDIQVDINEICQTRDADFTWCMAALPYGMSAILSPPVPFTVSLNPQFHNKSGEGSPNPVDIHQSHSQYTEAANEHDWIGHARPFIGDDSFSGSSGSPATLVTGTLWKFGAGQVKFNDRDLPIMAACGNNTLRDISGPSSTIGGTSTNFYQYCKTLAGGECRGGSTAGDVYVNCPYVQYPYCVSQASGTTQTEVQDICIGNMGSYAMGVGQINLTRADPDGLYGRMQTHGFSRYRWVHPFWSVKIVPDASVYFVWSIFSGGLRNTVWALQNTEFPSADSLNRGNFPSYEVNIGTPSTAVGAVDNAVVKFGYNSGFQCTTRLEPCLAGSSGTVQWASETVTGIACAAGCKIKIPVVFGKIFRYQIILRDVSNATLWTYPTTYEVIN